MPTVSAVVLTYNEADIIRPCLERLQWVDELIVVDSFSKDNTREIAEAAGAKVLTHPFRNFSEQFNWGMEQATSDWVFLVDADEFVTEELRDSVIQTLAAEPQADIYSVRRDSYVFGRLMRSSSWSGERVPRLFRHGAVRYIGEVHPDPQIGGRRVDKLDGVLIHYTYRSMAKYFEKFQLYSTLWAEKAWANGRRTGVPTALVSSLWRVFHNYFIRGEIRDGTVGFVSSIFAGMHTFIRHMKLWGLQNAAEFARIHDEEKNDAPDRQ